MSKEKIKLINVVTCYANESEVIEYAREVNEQINSHNIHLVVVVNKLGEMSLNSFKSTLIKNIYNVSVYNSKENLGYLNGLIFGYNNYIINNPQPNWVIMSNTDIKYAQYDFFNKFMDTRYDEDIWCVAPSVFSPSNNRYENPQYVNRHSLRSLNKRIFIFNNYMLAYFYFKLANLKSKFAKRKKLSSRNVYSAHGCYFILRRDMLNVLVDKQYGALMYSEEAYIAEIIKKYQKTCYYDHNIEINHEGSTVTNKLNIQSKCKYYMESLKYIRDQFYLS